MPCVDCLMTDWSAWGSPSIFRYIPLGFFWKVSLSIEHPLRTQPPDKPGQSLPDNRFGIPLGTRRSILSPAEFAECLKCVHRPPPLQHSQTPLSFIPGCLTGPLPSLSPLYCMRCTYARSSTCRMRRFMFLRHQLRADIRYQACCRLDYPRAYGSAGHIRRVESSRLHNK